MSKPILRIPLRIQPSSLQRPLQIIEDRNHIPSHLSLPTKGRGLKITRYPLPVVLEVSLRPLGKVQILVPLPMSVSQKRVEVLFDLGAAVVPLSRTSRG
jgi:hypothetical protein